MAPGIDPPPTGSGVQTRPTRQIVVALRTPAKIPAAVGRNASLKSLPRSAVCDRDTKRFKNSDGNDRTPESATPLTPHAALGLNASGEALPNSAIGDDERLEAASPLPIQIKTEGSMEDTAMVVDTPDVINGPYAPNATPQPTPMMLAESETPVTIDEFAESEGNLVVPEKPAKRTTRLTSRISAANPTVGEALEKTPPSAATSTASTLPDERDNEGFCTNKGSKESNGSGSIVLDEGTGESAIVVNEDNEPKTVQRTIRITRSVMKPPNRSPTPSSPEASPETSGGSVVSEDRGGLGTDSMGLMAGGLNKNMELKMSKKISGTKLPSNMRELLATGLLEGLPVKYIACTKKQIELKGMVKGTMILCYCASCKGSKAISAFNFEQHAGSSKKHPSDFIYLENGRTIRNVLEACKIAPLDMLEASIQSAIGPVARKEPSICQICKEPSDTSHLRKFGLCDSCLRSDQPQTIPSPSSSVGLSMVCDSSGSTSKSKSSIKKIAFGRLTKKHLGLHKLVFMGDLLPEGSEVGYYVRGQRLLQGYIKDSGIYCQCCKTVVSPSQFEAHAGQAKRRKPYNNIYTSNGVSLHELSVSLSKGRKLSARESDDLCSICADGGELLLCDLCPRAFHVECVGLPSIPMGDWHCQYCQSLHQRDKCVEYNDNAIAAGRVAGVDPIEQIFKRCIRIVEAPETDVGGCVFCRRHDFSKSFGPRTVLLCDQCEREYHVGCMKDHNMSDLKEIPEGEWFCCSECSRIHAALQELLVLGAVRLPDLDSDIIRRKREEKGISMDGIVDVRWQLLSGRTPNNSKLMLSRAVSIFHESFDPIVDSRTGRDLIPQIVNGRNIGGQDYGGMYSALLTVDSSVVSAGVLRVLGSEVAELPLVATKRERQGQGYFQALFSCIERLLVSLNVKHFVLPASEEAESMWIDKFGFTRITPDKLQEYTRGAHVVSFQGTSMLYKPVAPICQVPSEGLQ